MGLNYSRRQGVYNYDMVHPDIRSYLLRKSKTGRLASTGLLISFSLLMATSLSCNGLKFQSRWLDRDITVDGSFDDWEGALLYSEDKAATVGFLNDDEYLYLCLFSADQQVLMRAVAAGFTVWFEGSGKKDERLTVKYPIGGTMPRRERFQPGENERADRIAQSIPEQSELVITKDDRRKKLESADLDDYGLEAKIGRHMERMVYEIRVPLHSSENRPFAINPRQGKPIKVGFELGEMKMPDRKRPPRGDFRMDGGGRPGGMGPGGPPGGRRPEQSPEFKFEIKVKLAGEPDTTDS